MAGAAAGLLLGLLVTALSDRVYEARGLLQVTVTADVRAVDPEDRRLPAETVAATYAEWIDDRAFLDEIRPRVARGRLDTDELDERLDARVRRETALVELAGEGSTRTAASTLAREVSGAFIAKIQQEARQRGARVEEELRRRSDQLTAAITEALAGGGAGAGLEAARLEALRAERAAVHDELARAAARDAEQATAVTLAAAPVADADPASPRPLANAFGGVLLGLVAGLAATLLRRRPVPARRAEVEPTPEPAPPPRPRLLAPEAEAVVAGAVEAHATDASGVEYSADGEAWEPLPATEWDTTALPDGRYLLRAVADGMTSEGVPIYVDNTPPSVALTAPAPGDALVAGAPMRAQAADAGSAVERLEFMLSDGTAEWRTVAATAPPTLESPWQPGVAAGTYWLCVVATDRAGNQAASEPIPVVVAA